ncbi:MAG: methylmalonyl Co-A mutase-associated GTPase MeaB [Fluviicola sp.]|nr:methylmalonyl Co-A mutase-associated GTPase MeaB [Fluviicola sp.]
MNEQKVNDWLASRKQLRENRNAVSLFEALRSGNRTALSSSITLLESSLEKDREIATAIIRLCLPFSGNSVRIGITGVPGVGKSSFIERFGMELIHEGKRIAVLAIDPTSERTGGSILGDKTRMQQLSQEENAFIRPSAAGNTLGGVARKTRETIILCEAAGYDTILVETVGVGQSETMVHSMVDFFLLLLLAGAGDELQGIKRGIMEMADGLAVTKADGENDQRAKLAQRELKNAIHLFPPTASGWIPEVHTCSSVTGERIDAVRNMIHRFEEHAKIKGSFLQNRKDQDRNWMHETLRSLLLEGLYLNPAIHQRTLEMEEAVRQGNISAFEAAEFIYDLYKKQ